MAKTKVYVVYYSLHGHVGIVAREVHRGANSVQGVEATLWQVPETLPDRILDKMKAPSKEDIPVIRPEQLVEADGFLFGSPSRFGMMAAQLLAFFNATYELCQSQALAGKPAGIFWSTGFHGGGQELTAFTAITQLVHHGMLFVPLGYTSGISMFEMSEVKGGSSYGAGTYAGDGTRVPTVLELQQAFHQGVCLTMLASFVVIHYKKRHTVREPSSIFTPDEHFRISYSKLDEATNSFSNTNLLGVGTYGSVYKGILDQNGTVVAVKVLNLQQRGGSKSFISECTALRNVHHGNLVKILTSCSNVDSQGYDFQALLFEFMPNGNLENWL